jgi:thioredoxin reductase (NADPH)
VYLAQSARHVTILVRKGALGASMSKYLVRRIEESPNITVRTRAEIVALEGSDALERVRWRDERTGAVTEEWIRHVFVMMGAIPNTRWLSGRLALDREGFIVTGVSLTPEQLSAAEWPLARAPHALETSLPGVFAIGDVRGGNMKRVASSVGEGASAIGMIHQVLRG